MDRAGILDRLETLGISITNKQGPTETGAGVAGSSGFGRYPL